MKKLSKDEIEKLIDNAQVISISLCRYANNQNDYFVDIEYSNKEIEHQKTTIEVYYSYKIDEKYTENGIYTKRIK